MHDNGLYALTTGQTSPATPHGFKTKSTPQGNPDYPLMPITMAIAAGATFVARAFSNDIKELKDLYIQANEHKGFALVDVMQPCQTFNKVLTHEFYQENKYYLGDDHDVTNKEDALKKSLEFGEEAIPLGIFYKEEKSSYEGALPQLAETPLIEHSPVRKDLDGLFKKYI